MSDTPAAIASPEVNFLDDKSKKVILGFLKSPLVKVMLGNAKSKTSGVKVSALKTDEAGIHFTLEDTVAQKKKDAVITTADIAEIVRLVME